MSEVVRREALAMAECVPFHPVWASDPVREMRDGSMLHIMRHHRPKRGIHLPIQRDGGLEKSGSSLERKRFVLSTKWADGTAGSGI